MGGLTTLTEEMRILLPLPLEYRLAMVYVPTVLLFGLKEQFGSSLSKVSTPSTPNPIGSGGYCIARGNSSAQDSTLTLWSR